MGRSEYRPAAPSPTFSEEPGLSSHRPPRWRNARAPSEGDGGAEDVQRTLTPVPSRGRRGARASESQAEPERGQDGVDCLNAKPEDGTERCTDLDGSVT